MGTSTGIDIHHPTLSRLSNPADHVDMVFATDCKCDVPAAGGAARAAYSSMLEVLPETLVKLLELPSM
jgi:hypothetical protein